MKKIPISFLLMTLVLSSVPLVYAGSTVVSSPTQQVIETQQNSSQTQEQATQEVIVQETQQSSSGYITRGEAVHDVVETFDLRAKNANFIGDCLNHLDECFFVFTAMTRYNQVSLANPLQLYPDVPQAYKYASDINLSTMLGLVHGNIEVKDSPFNPRAYMSRIHALKVVLGAAGLIDWREKFELVRDLGNEDILRSETTTFGDVNALRDDTWWYPRYVNFALDSGIIDTGKYFRPDEPITVQEYNDMLQRALKASVNLNAATSQQTQSPGNSSQQAFNS